MKRRHLFEFTDLSFWPATLRALLTDYLDYIGKIARPFEPHCDLIAEAMDAARTDRVLDLCSGGGGPWFHLLPRVEQLLAREVTVTLSDKFPSDEAQRRTQQAPGITHSAEPVDAMSPPDGDGLWSMFDSFHHFEPEQARTVLKKAVDGGHPIVIFEMMRRSMFDALGALRIPLLVLFLTPFLPGFRFWRLLFTYLIPIAPLAIAWDGFVSVLRCYTPAELRAMTDSLGGRPYTWKIGDYRKGMMSVTYLVGYPKSPPS